MGSKERVKGGRDWRKRAEGGLHYKKDAAFVRGKEEWSDKGIVLENPTEKEWETTLTESVELSKKARVRTFAGKRGRGETSFINRRRQKRGVITKEKVWGRFLERG